MKTIEKYLKRDFESAVDFFNVGDFRHFFGDIRLSIEWFSKLMIHEVLNDEKLANDIISGKKNIELNKSSQKYCITNTPQKTEPEGSYFITLLKYSIYNKYPDFRNSQEKSIKRLNRAIESVLSQMLNYYSVASELAEHTGLSQLNITTQAKACAVAFPKFFDDIKKIFPETKKTFDSFPTFNISSVDNFINNIENTLDLLYDETNKFGSNGGDKFIILLPSECRNLTANITDALFTIPCTLICDFGSHKGKNSFSTFINNKIWNSKVKPINSREDFIVGSSMVNWHFCQGREDIGEHITSNFKEWKINRSRTLKDILMNVVKKNSTNHFYILNFIEETKYAPYIFNHIIDVFGDDICAKNRCDIFSFSQNKEIEEELIRWSEDNIINHKILNVNLENLLSFIQKKNSDVQLCIDSIPHKSNIDFSHEEIIYYEEAGINIFRQSEAKTNNNYDFYYGAEISWEELASDLDVKRTGYEKFKQNILSIINDPKQKTILYTLKHNPGAGGTTMVRRLAFDISKLNSELDNFSCLTIFLKTYNEKTNEYILNLSEKKLDNDFLVLIIEEGKVADENINRLFLRLNARQRNAIILRLSRTTQQNIQGGSNTTILYSRLNEEDAKLFLDKYSKYNKPYKVLFTDEELKKGLEVVDFPLKLKDDITSIRLNNYILAFMNELPHEVKIFIGFVAFTTYYAGKSLNQNLVKSYFNHTVKTFEWNNTLHKILIQELDENGELSGCWRPRYQSFALPILNAVWGLNWKLQIGQIAVSFLNECKKAGLIGQWDKDLLYGIFVLRRGSDFKEASDDERSKFAKLIQDVMDNEQRPEEIYNSLVNNYPDDPIFLGHYGRFLYEQAYVKKVMYNDDLYVKAELFISNAIDICPNIDDNHHMKGMLNLRKIQSLKCSLEKIDDKTTFELEDLIQKWMYLAKEGFENSIELNPASPYGFTAQSQLYSECIKVAKIIKNVEDYSFCDKEPIYVEILELLGSCLNQLGHICQSYDEEQSYMKQSIRIYNQIRAFHRQILGNPISAVKHYRNLYETCSTINKSYYGKQFVTSILYARTEGLKNNKNKNNTAWAMRHLSPTDREEVSRVLQYQRTQSELDCYENLFWFKMSGNEEFPLEEAINLLVEWLRQYEVKGKTGAGRLKALYYLAVCYSSLAINSDTYNEDYVRNAKKYFKLAGELAETFEKNSMAAYSYMGEELDAHCILQPSQLDEARIFEAVISKIDRRKGYVRLKCGLEAFFPANNEYNSLADEGKTYLRGRIGFRYSGLGLYKFDKITENSHEQLAEISDRLDVEEDCESVNVNIETEIVEEPLVKRPLIKLKQVGFIDNPSLLKSNKTSKKIQENYNEDKLYYGRINLKNNIVKGDNGMCTIDKKIGFAPECTPKEYDYEENESVVFKVKIGIDRNDNSKPWYYAINIKPACEE